MPQWNPSRNPDNYPATWHSIIKQPPGKHLFLAVKSPVAFRKLTKKFSAFRACLRAHPAHPTAQALVARAFRLEADHKSSGEVIVYAIIHWADELINAVIEGLHQTNNS